MLHAAMNENVDRGLLKDSQEALMNERDEVLLLFQLLLD